MFVTRPRTWADCESSSRPTAPSALVAPPQRQEEENRVSIVCWFAKQMTASDLLFLLEVTSLSPTCIQLHAWKALLPQNLACVQYEAHRSSDVKLNRSRISSNAHLVAQFVVTLERQDHN